jgi:hypothetical protein
MDRRCGSSSKAPVLQAQSPEFKPQSYQKKRKKEKSGCLGVVADSYKSQLLWQQRLRW